MRVTKLSAGIQLAPFMKTGAPFTLMKKLLPIWSRACTTSIVRRPMRVRARVEAPSVGAESVVASV